MALQMMATQIKPFDLGRALLNKARLEEANTRGELNQGVLRYFDRQTQGQLKQQELTNQQMDQELELSKKRLQNFDREFEANMATKKAQADAYMAQLKTEKIKQHGEMASFVRNSLLHTKTQLVSDPQAYQQAFDLFNQVEGKFKEAAGLSSSGSTLMEPDKFFKLSPEQRAAYIDSQIIDADTVNKAALEKIKSQGEKEYSPSILKKMISERQALIDSGVPEDDLRIKAYDNKLTGTDIEIEELTPEEIDLWGSYLNIKGAMPTLGRGKQATKIRTQIVKSAARQALQGDPDAPEVPEGRKPSDVALEIIGTQSDTKSIQGSLNFLEKQVGAMGSFARNLEMQVDKVSSLSEDLKTFDTRLLNVPLRALRGKIAGSPLQAKYDMYLTEIESEIGKLATGSSASIAELSATAQEKWAKIHDKNLNVSDMLELLDETKAAAQMRVESVQEQLSKTREKMRTRDYGDKKAGGKTSNTITVTNPDTGEEEIWDLDTEQRIK